jgi:hypothetical protein
MARTSRKFRSGLGAWRAMLNPHQGAKMPMGLIRRQDKAKAEQEFPELLSTFKGINAELKENLAKGRFDYRKSLEKIYRLVWGWKSEGFWENIQKDIARLRGVALRPNANQFTGIVAMCSDRDRKTVSRWSQELDDALKKKIPPNRLMRFLDGP